jgi:hypothetical protein
VKLKSYTVDTTAVCYLSLILVNNFFAKVFTVCQFLELNEFETGLRELKTLQHHLGRAGATVRSGSGSVYIYPIFPDYGCDVMMKSLEKAVFPMSHIISLHFSVSTDNTCF